MKAHIDFGVRLLKNTLIINLKNVRGHVGHSIRNIFEFKHFKVADI